MASYMYNPSQKVTELLSQYLEFDPAQLEIGIWSGHLSLTNVDLREEAIYPLLNGLHKSPSDEQARHQNGGAFHTNNESQHCQQQQDYVKPPLKFKLVSGKIGSLSMRIPWKRLVWGQGDVQVDLRNVVIVLALESSDEALSREATEKGETEFSIQSRRLYPEDEMEDEDKPDPDPLGIHSSRNKKQSILREAEKRNSEKRSVATWLAALQRREQQKKSKRGLDNPSLSLKQQETHLDRWLRSTTKDFFWRFAAGLQMNIENLKIVMIQDGIELGVMVPSNRMLAGIQQPNNSSNSKEVRRMNREENVESDASASATHPGTPPQTMVYEGEYDDGEHVDKLVKLIGISFFVRRIVNPFRTSPLYRYPLDVSTSDFVMRPVDVDFNFSLFFPHPPEKRAKRKAVAVVTEPKLRQGIDERSMASADFSSVMNNTTDSAKRRRGKREKRPFTEDMLTEPEVNEGVARTNSSKEVHSPNLSRTKPGISRSFNSGVPTRRLSDPDPLKAAALGKRYRHVASGAETVSTATSMTVETRLPLAQPDDIQSYYALATQQAIRNNDLVPRFDARLSVGAVHVIFSTKHYVLINSFLAAGAKLRNGRPTIPIGSFVRRHTRNRHSYLETTDDGSSCCLSLGSKVEVNYSSMKVRHGSDENRDNLLTKSEVIRLWWLYVLGSVLWEIRQRKKLRRMFQRKFLSFSWAKQRFKRIEYVNLYMAARLKSNVTSFQSWIDGFGDPDSRLLEIEDQLCVEQILLYRSIARCAHVRGFTEMPRSIIELRDHKQMQLNSVVPVEGIIAGQSGDVMDSRDLRRDSIFAEVKNFDGNEDALNSFVSTIEASCEIARKRRDAEIGVKLEAYSPFQHRLKLNGRNGSVLGMDDLSNGLSANQTIRTFKTNATSLRDSISSHDVAIAAMVVSLYFSIAELDLVVTEDGDLKSGFDDAEHEADLKISSTLVSADSSVVSDLTNDGMSYGDGDLEISRRTEDVDTEPIAASTDYLLFQTPEKVILQVIIKALNCSTLGRSGGSRNINFSVGQVVATGADGVNLLCVGDSADDAPPVNEIQVSTACSSFHMGDKARTPQPRNALTLSLVDKMNDNILQCDISQLRGCLHHQSLSKLLDLTSVTNVHFPKSLLQKTPKEDLRLSILQQNSRPQFMALNCSLRIHGFELLLPVTTVISSDSKVETRDESKTKSASIMTTGSSIHCGIMEIYSGSVVDGLRTARMESSVGDLGDATSSRAGRRRGTQVKKLDTRQLRMLDVPDLLERRRSLLSYNCVLTVTDVDLYVVDPTNSRQLSFFENSLDVEMMLTVNADSAMDYDRAKTDVVVEVSPVHLLLSEKRLMLLSHVVPSQWHCSSQVVSSSPSREQLIPRLEILSRFLRYSFEFSIMMVRVSFLSQERLGEPSSLLTKRLQMEKIAKDFLLVVSRFDLVFPLEESLSAAMQICIDRLSGLGLPLVDAWEATNTVMLNFLEGIAEVKKSDNDLQFLSNSTDESVTQGAIHDAAECTISMFLDRLEPTESEPDLTNVEIVLDIPDGLAASLVDLFYDRHLCFCVPTLFVVNGKGIHVVRLNPSETRSVLDDEYEASNRSEKVEISEDDKKSEVVAPDLGIVFHQFDVDRNYRFGRGGHPLAVLGTDAITNEEAEKRERESLVDLELGDLEVFFCPEILKDMIESLTKVLSPLGTVGDKSRGRHSAEPQDESTRVHVLCSCSSNSILLVADTFFPFCRFTLTNVIARKNSMPTRKGCHVGAQSFEILNLTPEGELHPIVVSALPGYTSLPLRICFEAGAERSLIDVEFNGLRVVLLRQFLNEILQYALTDQYGLGLLLNSIRTDASTDRKTSIALTMKVFDSSILLPRSTESCDMIAIELDMVSVSIGRVGESFRMPTATSRLCIPALHSSSDAEIVSNKVDQGDRESMSQKQETGVTELLKRTFVQLVGFHIFSSLPEYCSSPARVESPSFRFFYAVDGRATKDKRVYCSIVPPDDLIPDDESRANIEISNRFWKEITTEKSSIDVIVEYAPHLRILICDPIDGNGHHLNLDIALSQFCLLLSIWYSNMQELPVMFPYSAAQLEAGARSPSLDHDFPEYGTEAFKELVRSDYEQSSEFGMQFEKISVRFSFDDPFVQDEADYHKDCGLAVSLANAVVHVKSDVKGIVRIGVGSSMACLVDESRTISDVLTVGEYCSHNKSWADCCFGIDLGNHSLTELLPQAFQLSVCMMPACSLYNLGLDRPFMALPDFSTIYKFLDFVSAYASNPLYGHPAFEAAHQLELIKNDLLTRANRGPSITARTCSVTDFRLWLTRPTLSIPCDSLLQRGPGVRVLTETGLWYKYCSLDFISSQEIVADGVSLVVDDRFILQSDRSKNDTEGRSLITGLSLGLRLDFNAESNHTDLSVQIPLMSPDTCGITSPRISVPPTILQPPTICVPFRQPERYLGPAVCEITCIIELLPLAVSALVGLFGGNKKDDTTSTSLDDPSETVQTMWKETRKDILIEQSYDGRSPSVRSEPDDSTISLVATVKDIRVFMLDPVLGPHLPIAVLSVSSFSFTMSQFAPTTRLVDFVHGEAPPEDLQISVEGHFWADYFKLGLTRSWEPLVEAYRFCALGEKSRLRGSGLSLKSDSSLHINASSALLVIVDEVVFVCRRLILETFAQSSTGEGNAESSRAMNQQNHEAFSVVDAFGKNRIIHEITAPLNESDRVSFSLCNKTGQKIRIYRAKEDGNDDAAKLTYIDHSKTTKLFFRPSVSVVKNLALMEVPYPGFLHTSGLGHEKIPAHAVDIQIPGFHWLRGIHVDTFGRKFADITPRSAELVFKMTQDWRLRNAMKLLVEVGMKNGGRQVTVRSLFSVVNRTNHNVCLEMHPDPSYLPSKSRRGKKEHDTSDKLDDAFLLSNCDTILPGDSFQIPSLLAESALRLRGSHLGCVWMKPGIDAADSEALQSFIGENHEISRILEVDFSSKPLSLSKLVGDTSVAFDQSFGRDIAPDKATTAVQMSCPVLKDTGDRLAPFCYALEIGRSPIVRQAGEYDVQTKKDSFVHGPVAYSISIHPPLVIANLLPEKSRFELMHATRRTILWFGDLEPGQQVSVHSVGLDAPVLLLLNLGFAKTPVGEGALIHHGSDPPPGTRDNLIGLKSIGKAGKAVSKQIGKTLTAIGESPDQRGLQKVSKAQNPRYSSLVRRQNRDVKKDEGIFVPGADSELDGEATDGTTYKIDSVFFFPHDVASETTIVDGLGQRLTLNIDNVRGGGGQRRVSVFSPYWIVNCTEHPLRYRQEKSSIFVSGTVHSPERDGSLPLSGGRSRAKYFYHKDNDETTKTIFSGTFGALATSPGRCDLPPEKVAKIIDANLSLDSLASLAFMFNFHEGTVINVGSQRLCVQLGDGTGETRYESDWSRGFSIDSVGISQIVTMHCKDGRSLEITVVVSVAPGYLSRYTKVVRFLPRYVLVNTLPYPIRLWQDSSGFRPSDRSDSHIEKALKWRLRSEKGKKTRATKSVNQYEALWGRTVALDERDTGRILSGTAAHANSLYITTVSPAEVLPFNLPDSRGERQLRIDPGGPFNLTASFSADIPGEHTLRIERAIDIKLLPHVSTRASPQYEVRLPPSNKESFTGELGIWFETEWGSNRSLIVKSVKKNSYSFRETDVHVGDELLSIDGVPVSRMTFTDAMSILRTRLVEVSTVGNLSSLDMNFPRRMMQRQRSNLRLGSSRSFDQRTAEETTALATPLRLIFRTVEERLRMVRLKAAKISKVGSGNVISSTRASSGFGSDETSDVLDARFLKAELTTLHHSELSMFLVLRDNPIVPFLIENRSIHRTIYYRQRSCFHHPWKSVKPGQCNEYAWDEPMKPKRLSVRVAWDHEAHRLDDDEEQHFMDTAPPGKPPDNDRRRKRKVFGGHVEDEEDSSFSPSLSVRLEEIGFRDYLMIPNHNGGIDEADFLVADVDVLGTMRVLTISDAAKEDEESRMIRELAWLEKRLDDEGNTLHRLQQKNILIDDELPQSQKADSPNTDCIGEAVDDAKQLMDDYSDESTISGCHQIVVEVIEALGLRPESSIDACNPYAEVTLKSDSFDRKSLFKKKDSRRTYFIRKTDNPAWSGQSFVFCVPPKAVSTSRGHSIQVVIRSYHSFRAHERLGNAQVDLHSVRDQEPLVGWFPLAGRTGRRELENQLSHWGRGSVKLRVQWINAPSALMRYFILLSEGRLADLLERRRSIAVQLEKKKESDEMMREGIDGFKAVRVYDLLSDKKRVGFRDPKSHDGNVIKKLIEPLTEKKRRENRHDRLFAERPVEPILHSPGQDSRDNKRIGPHSPRSIRSPSPSRGLRMLSKQRTHNSPNFRKLEEQLSEKRLHFQQFTSRRAGADNQPKFISIRRNECRIAPNMFKSWTPIQAIFNETEFEIAVRDDAITIMLAPQIHITDDDEFVETSACQRLILQKLHLPGKSPLVLKDRVKEYASMFIVSRGCFERAARRSIRTILNPGGWLTVRPITALNLPDTFTGMFVKVRYGSEVIASETADAKVIPSWYKPDLSGKTGERADGDIHIEAEALLGDHSENNLHIYVAPQQTSGSIRISVIGERSHQQLNTRAELGVCHLPLGSAIAACIECADGRTQDDAFIDELNGSLAYVRWFPLMNPRDAVPVAGDGGLSLRPNETEKTSDNLFNDYFAPCLQLALIWSPDAEEDVILNEESGDDTEAKSVAETPLGSVQNDSSPSVQSYFSADIGRISLALIDSQRAVELISFSALDIDARYWVTKAKTRMGVSVGWVQLDYQDDNVREPVILAPTPSDFLLPVLQVLAVKDNIRSKTEVLTFDFIDVSIAEFDLTIEESLLFDMYSFFHAISIRKGVNRKAYSDGEVERSASAHENTSLITESKLTEEATLLSLIANDLKDDVGNKKKIYIDQLFLGVVKVNLSYLKGKRISWESSKQGRLVDARFERVLNIAGGEYLMQQRSPDHQESDVFTAWSRHTSDDDRCAEDGETGSNNIPALLATIIPTLSDAPVRLQGKALNHVFESPTEIFQSIREFYLKETLNQIYKIIGSLDFVGNPTMLVTSFLSGLRDLVLVPTAAFSKSPTDAKRLGLGVAQGTLSLFSHSISGFFGVLAKVSAASGQAVAVLSFDADFRDWHRDKVVVEATNLNREWKRRGLQSFGHTLTRPFLDLVVGVASGVAGVLTSPMKGYRRGGSVGLVKGTIIGSIGVIAKPTVGVLDAFTHFSASIYDIAKSVNVLDRRLQPAHQLRLPYTFGMLTILEPFRPVAARAAYLLKLFPIQWRNAASQHPSEALVHVEVLPDFGTDTYAIATSCRILLVKLKKELTGALSPTRSWEVNLAEGSAIASRVSDHGHNGVALTITVTKPSDAGQGDRSLTPAKNSISLGGSLPSSVRSMSVLLSDDKISSIAAEECGHGTGRSVKGDIVEWFAILAEYQNRRQLTRLHNAISCIVGDFDAIIRDPWIGRPGSSEGYTCFGMYFFEPDEEIELVDSPYVAELEDLPWISHHTFAALSLVTQDDHRSYLSQCREDLSFEKEFMASKEEGGPEWLVLARARATTLLTDSSPRADVEEHKPDTCSASTSTERSQSRGMRSILKFGRRRYTDHESRHSPALVNDDEFLRSDLSACSFESALQTESMAFEYDSNEDSVDESRGGASHESSPRVGTGVRRRRRTSSHDRDSRLSFRSAISCFPSSRSGQFRFEPLSTNLGVSSHSTDDSKVCSITRSGQSQAANATADDNAEKDERQVASSNSDLRFDHGDLAVKDNLSSVSAHEHDRMQMSRMDRIESLLERLLVFSSEQALSYRGASPQSIASSGEIDDLQQQLRDLRTELDLNKRELSSYRMTSDEVAALRSELSAMRALMDSQGPTLHP